MFGYFPNICLVYKIPYLVESAVLSCRIDVIEIFPNNLCINYTGNS